MKKLVMATLIAATATVANGQRALKTGINRVTFKSENEKMVGNLTLPSTYKKGNKLPVVIIIGPFTQVKEQIGAVYSKKMAEYGYAAFAFDFRFWGESGGEPRYFESPKDKIQDIKNAITFLTTVAAIDSNRIGLVGVCFGAGYVADVVAKDNRIKSWATVAAWLNDEGNLEKLFTKPILDYRDSISIAAANKFKETEKMEYAPAYEVGNNKAAMFFTVDYYGNPQRGAIAQWTNKYALTSHKVWHDFNVWGIAPTITTPVIFVHSYGSALPNSVKKLYNEVKGKKELYWATGEHTEFYDKPAQVNEAAKALTSHFNKTL